MKKAVAKVVAIVAVVAMSMLASGTAQACCGWFSWWRR